MLDSKWTFFIGILFIIGNLLSNSIDDLHTGQELLDVPTLSEKQLQNLTFGTDQERPPTVESITSSSILQLPVKAYELG